ncbi:histidinol-phosphate aminotransferase [Ascobolus immersus RN42]|uniref:histidinol-phosphate transaminase n=1 Tax=Ascobolus immersus RN42 TaxID=1160509 RepID=A0A3N4IAJ8_ASCIM|nr:histidinol-phosphate aminotransferase [Ascobolus immersus RN42]
MASTSSAFNLATCARPNILKLIPYRCARDDYKDDGTNILLDANENSFGPSLPLNAEGKLEGFPQEIDLAGLNRYPDPHLIDLKQQLCDLRNPESPFSSPPLTPANLYCGVGSDEAIDMVLRAFCAPGKEKILTCPPTYGMYSVSADVNDLSVVKVPLLLTEDLTFQLDPPAINKTLSENPDIKVAYFTSPGNPTGNLLKTEDIKTILANPDWNGIVVVDEAYVDFSPVGSSLAPLVTEYKNLIVMQTLSKAFGLAGIRFGIAFADAEVATLLNSMKAPYNISSPTVALAGLALGEKGTAVKKENIAKILEQRDRLVKELPTIPGIGRFLGGFHSNYLLVEILNKDGKPDNITAKKVYETLAQNRAVVVRFRGTELNCTGCLRITIGTEKENTELLKRLKVVLEDVRSS